jgi:hypothetical protein
MLLRDRHCRNEAVCASFFAMIVGPERLQMAKAFIRDTDCFVSRNNGNMPRNDDPQ